MTANPPDTKARYTNAREPVEQEFSIATRPLRPQGRSIPMHRHFVLEIALVRNGECEIILQNEQQHIKRGNAFFIPAGLPHGFRCNSPQGVQFVVIQFKHLDEELILSLTNTPPIGMFSLSEAELTRFIEIGYSLQHEVSGALPYASLKAQSLKLELLVLLLRANEVGTSPPHIEQRELIENAINWLQRHSHDESVSIANLAKRVGLSPSYFRMLFNQIVGSSPKRYLTGLRLQTSKSLMMQGEHTLAEIATLSGFHNPQQFSKLFRQYTGMSPSRWREAMLISSD